MQWSLAHSLGALKSDVVSARKTGRKLNEFGAVNERDELHAYAPMQIDLSLADHRCWHWNADLPLGRLCFLWRRLCASVKLRKKCASIESILGYRFVRVLFWHFERS